MFKLYNDGVIELILVTIGKHWLKNALESWCIFTAISYQYSPISFHKPYIVLADFNIMIL